MQQVMHELSETFHLSFSLEVDQGDIDQKTFHVLLPTVHLTKNGHKLHDDKQTGSRTTKGSAGDEQARDASDFYRRQWSLVGKRLDGRLLRIV